MPSMKHYQILVKGIASNSLKLFETTKYKIYKEMLENFKDSTIITIITTNIYWEE